MKGRSNRLSVPSASSEDWGDGSWTVDCSCGVTFDDGEEMVDCDVCGVWVHTRCSRFVKGESSFACDRCKGKKRQRASSIGPAAESNGNYYGINGGLSGATNTEETEVAQLLAELPTKTDPCPPSASHRPPAFKLWTRAPIEERVHIQGVPGGDPAIFQGLSSVFTSELWKCTGYVAKRFNFKYKEFPCWEDDEDGENPTNRGADLLVSLSKDVTPRRPFESYGYDQIQKTVRKDRKIPASGALLSGKFQAYAKKERSRNREAGINSGKRKESTGGKEQSSKKKSRSSVDKTAKDIRKKGSSSRDEIGKPIIPGDDFPKPVSFTSENLKAEAGKDVMFSMGDEAQKPKDISVDKICDDDAANEVPSKPETCDEHASQKAEVSPAITNAGGSVKEEADDFTSVVVGQRTSNKESGNLGDTDENSSTVSLKAEKQPPGSGDLNNHSSGFVGASVFQNSSRIKVEEEATGPDGVRSDQSKIPSLPATDEGLDRLAHLDATAETPSACLQMNAEVSGVAKDSPLCDKKLLEDGVSTFSGGADLKKVKPEEQISAGECSSKHEERVKHAPVSSASSASSESKLVPSVEKSTLPSSALNFCKPSDSGAICKSPSSTTSSTAERTIVKDKMKVRNSVTAASAEEVAKQTTKSHSRERDREKRHSSSSNTASRSHGEHALESRRRHEKISVAISHQSFGTLTNSATLHPPGINSSATLSDEELARLLHQELNSSPRVPRVPRARQSDRFNSAAASTLSKCSGGKDQAQASRRKNKEDSCRDRSRSSYGMAGETRKGDRSAHPDVRKENGSASASASARRGGMVVSTKKSAAMVNEQTISSTGGGSWSKTLSPDLAASHAHTLPGLIDEIMSKGNCRTYEELCSAVLPHWKNLRKPNGDKYAYSSHSQAVLDCLRNRSQWAHLIDRGPKTNSSRKRRKPSAETDPSLVDSESEDAADEPDDKDEGESHPDDFPKGRRNARKRRRLVLRGRVLRNRPHQNGVSSGGAADSFRSSASSSSDDGASRSYSDDDDPDRRRPAVNSSSSVESD